MNDSSTGPVIIFFLFILRCLIPLAIMFGISYILQRLGLVGYHTAEDTQHQTPEEPDTGKQNVDRGFTQKKGAKKTSTPQRRSRSK